MTRSASPPLADAPAETSDVRADLLLIASLVEEGVRVLDVGCGDGTLLEMLVREKEVDGRGMELSQKGVNACVARGLSVIQGDADVDLTAYPDRAFDYVILSQTIQATRNPRRVLEELMRIGRHVIVSFPNFGYWRVRLSLAFGGHMPVTEALDQPWYATPNIHLCTLSDFLDLCQQMEVTIEKAYALSKGHRFFPVSTPVLFANLFAEEAILMLTKGMPD